MGLELWSYSTAPVFNPAMSSRGAPTTMMSVYMATALPNASTSEAMDGKSWTRKVHVNPPLLEL